MKTGKLSHGLPEKYKLSRKLGKNRKERISNKDAPAIIYRMCTMINCIVYIKNILQEVLLALTGELCSVLGLAFKCT